MAKGPEANIKVTADVAQSVRELQRLGTVFEKERTRLEQPFKSSAVIQKDAINPLLRKRFIEEGMAREEAARNLINPTQYKGLGQEAALTFQQGLLQEISKLDPKDFNFYDKFIQLTRKMGGPINFEAIAQGRDKSLQETNTFLEELGKRTKATMGQIDQELAKGNISWEEAQRRRVIAYDMANKSIVDKTKEQLEKGALSERSFLKLSGAIKPIDPQAIARASDEALQEVKRFNGRMEGLWKDAKGKRDEALAAKTIDHTEHARQGRLAAEEWNKAYLQKIAHETAKGASPEAVQNLRNQLREIRPDKVAQAQDQTLAAADKMLKELESKYRMTKAKIRDDWNRNVISENQMIRQGAAAGDALNKGITQAIDQIKKDHGNISEAALHRLTSGLKIVNPRTVKDASDQGLAWAESFTAGVRERLQARLGMIDLRQYTQNLPARDAYKMRVEAVTQANHELGRGLRELQQQGPVSAAAFNKIAGELRNVDQYARHTYTSMRQLRGMIFDFLAVYAAVNFVKGAVMSVVRAFNSYLQAGEEVARFEGVERAFIKSAAAINESSQGLLDKSRKATRGVIDDWTLMQSANMAVSLQAVKSGEDMEKLMFAGRTMARVMGIDATKGVHDLTIALARGSTRVLDNIGVVLKQEQAERLYAAQLGKTREQLTATEKRRAFAVIGLQKAYERALQLGDAEDSAAEATSRFNAKMRDNVRDIKATFVETETMRKSLDTMTQAMFDQEQGLVRWTRAFINFYDWVIQASYTALKTLTPLEYMSRELRNNFEDLRRMWKGLPTREEEAAPITAQIKTWKATVKHFQDLQKKGVMPEEMATKSIDAANEKLKELREERDKIMGVAKPTVDPFSKWFLNKFAPVKPPLPDGKPFTLDDDPEDPDSDKLSKYKKHVTDLISIYKNFTEQGRDTTHVVRALNQEYGKVKAYVDQNKQSLDENTEAYAQMQTQIRDALDNVSFDHYEKGAKQAIDQYRGLAELGMDTSRSWTELNGILFRTNDLLARGGLTEENRAKTLKLQREIKTAFVDAPLQRLEQEGRFIQDVLDRINERRLPGASGMEQRLRQYQNELQSLQNLRFKFPDLVDEKALFRIQKLVDEVTDYFDRIPVERLRREAGLITSQIDIQKETVGVTIQLYQKLLDVQRRIGMEVVRRGKHGQLDARSQELMQEHNRIKQILDERKKIEFQISSDVLAIQKKETIARKTEIYNQAAEWKKQGVNRVLIEMWVEAQLFKLRREKMAALEQAMNTVASTMGDAIYAIASQVEDLNAELRQLADNLIRAFANQMLARGIAILIDNLAQMGAAAKTATKDTADSAATATQTTAAAAGTGLTSAGASSMAANPLLGAGLIAGGFLLTFASGLLGRNKKEDEEAQYRAHLRALRQDRMEQFMNFTIVLPNVPINPRDRAWRETFAETMEEVNKGQIGRIKFEQRGA